jgi:hypothetical protein
MKPTRMRMVHDLITQYDLLDRMDVFVRSISFLSSFLSSSPSSSPSFFPSSFPFSLLSSRSPPKR